MFFSQFKLGWQLVIIISGQNNSSNHKSKSFRSSKHFVVVVWRGFGNTEVERTGKAEIINARGPGSSHKACCARYSTPGLKLKEEGTFDSLGLPISSVFLFYFCVRITPLRVSLRADLSTTVVQFCQLELSSYASITVT